MIQSPTQANPAPEQNKVQAPGSKPQETAANTNPVDAKAVGPNVVPPPGSNTKS
jgi:hypothetical protein